MAGTFVSDTMQDGAGNSTSTTNVIRGCAKAWGSYAYVGAGSSPTLSSAYNISSITRNSLGNYTFAFTNALADANYGVVGSTNQGATAAAGAISVTSRSTSNFVMQVGFAASLGGALGNFDFGVDFSVFD